MCVYNVGDKIYDILKKKSGIIINLKNKNCEKKYDKTNSTPYFHIVYDDETIDTSVNANYIIMNKLIYSEQPKYTNWKFFESVNQSILLPSYSNYKLGQRFINKLNQKYGTIKYLRNDSYEKYKRENNSLHYYYYVEYDDGTFNTYENGANLTII